jgi:hypothetical protein
MEQFGCMETVWDKMNFGMSDWVYYYGTEQTFHREVNEPLLDENGNYSGVIGQNNFSTNPAYIRRESYLAASMIGGGAG